MLADDGYKYPYSRALRKKVLTWLPLRVAVERSLYGSAGAYLGRGWGRGLYSSGTFQVVRPHSTPDRHGPRKACRMGR